MVSVVARCGSFTLLVFSCVNIVGGVVVDVAVVVVTAGVVGFVVVVVVVAAGVDAGWGIAGVGYGVGVVVVRMNVVVDGVGLLV